MFQDANLLVLENKSTSTQKRFKIFDDQQVFPVKKLNQQIQKELDKEDKHEDDGAKDIEWCVVVPLEQKLFID